VMESLVIKLIQNILTYMSEWRVSQVMPQPDSFGQVFVKVKSAGYGARNLRNLQCMGEACGIMIAQRHDKNLCFMLQSPEGISVQYAVTVALESRAYRAFLLLQRAST